MRQRRNVHRSTFNGETVNMSNLSLIRHYEGLAKEAPLPHLKHAALQQAEHYIKLGNLKSL